MVVAARPLPVGTVVQEQHLKTIEWSGGALPLGYISNPQDVIGRGLVSNLQENEPVLESKLAAKGAGGGLPVIITEGMRGLTMRVNEVSGVSGFVTPNTRVDVLLTMEDKINTGGEPATRIIMQDMKVLAAGQSLQPDKEGKPQSVPVVTFLVTPGTGRNAGPRLAAGQHPARAPESAGHHAGEDHGYPAERADGRPGRPADGRAAAWGESRARGRGAPAQPAGGRGVSRRRPHPHEVLT